MRNWNQKAVRERLQAFKEVAAAVPGNQRTAYTERGGRKMLPAHHPERLWIDSYSAIKTKISGVNATFVCHIREAGDEPKFELRNQWKG